MYVGMYVNYNFYAEYHLGNTHLGHARC